MCVAFKSISNFTTHMFITQLAQSMRGLRRQYPPTKIFAPPPQKKKKFIRCGEGVHFITFCSIGILIHPLNIKLLPYSLIFKSSIHFLIVERIKNSLLGD